MTHASPARDMVEAFRRDLRALEREIARQLDLETACCGVTLPQCHALLELSGAERSLSGLAAALDLDASTLSRTVESLVQAEWVERAVDPGDRRAVCLRLTTAGRRKVAAINAGVQHTYETLLAPLAEKERLQAARIVRVLAEGMRRLRIERAAREDCATSKTARSPRPKRRRS